MLSPSAFLSRPEQGLSLPEGLPVQAVSCRGASREFVRRWRELADRALEPNPFLDPDFLLPLLQESRMEDQVQLLTVANDRGELSLVCPVERIPYSPQLPFPHLVGYQSCYHFRGGMLVDAGNPDSAIADLLKGLAETSYRHGLILENLVLETELTTALERTASRNGFRLSSQKRYCRASLNLADLPEGDVLDWCSKSRRKSLRQSRRKLEQLGPVTFRVVSSASGSVVALQRFLNLEQQGWKKESGTAIGCIEPHRRFYIRMVTALAQRGKMLFGELRVGGRVIASTCNFLTGESLFAFKIGWDKDFQEGSPGLWAEIELVRYLRQHRSELKLLDSCTSPGSYLEHLWPHRLPVGTAVISGSRRTAIFTNVRETLRHAKRQLQF